MSANNYQYHAPPSANAIYRISRKSVHKSVEYNYWLTRTVPAIRLNFKRVSIPPKTPISVCLRANLDRRRDLDNILKPILDCLQMADVIPNDNYVDFIDLRRDFNIEKNHFTVEVKIEN